MKNSTFVEVYLIWTSLATLIPVSYSFLWLNPVIFVFKGEYNETYFKRYGEQMPNDLWNILLPMTITSPLITAMLGGYCAKGLLDKIGRKWAAIVCHCINVGSTLVVAIGGGVGNSYEAIIVGRIILGIYIGSALSINTVVIAELSTKHRQPFLQSFTGISLNAGAMLGPIMSYNKVFGTKSLWPFSCMFGCVPSILWLCTSYWMVESPYYLTRNGKKDEAFQAMKVLRTGDENAINSEIKEIEKEQKHWQELKTLEIVGVKKILSVPHYRRSFLAVIIIYSNNLLTGINSISYYSDWILLEAGLQKDHVTPITIGLFFLQVLVSLLGTKSNVRFGSKAVNVAGSVVIVVALIILTMSQALKERFHGSKYAAVAALVLFMLGWAGGTNIATFSLVGELTSDITRPTSMLFGSFAFWSTSWLVGFTAPYLMHWIAPFNFLPCIIWTIIAAAYMITKLPDTKGKTPREIQEYFKN